MGLRLVFSVLCFGGIVVACANGDTTTTSADGTEPVDASTSASSGSSGSAKLPPGSSSGSSGAADDSGTSSSGGADSGLDATADAKADATVDAGVDSGPTCATVAPSNACGLAPQCGCAVNQTCDVTNGTSGAVSCVLAGGGTQGTYCTSTTQCAKGLTCGYNACRPYCAAAGTSCAGAGLGPCAQYYDPTAGTPVTSSKVCSVTCDPRNPSAACGSNNCIYDETVSAPDCDKVGTVAEIGACTRYNDCKSGLGCAQHPVYGYECESWCRIGGSDCGILADCIDLYGAKAPTSGGVRLGHCQDAF